MRPKNAAPSRRGSARSSGVAPGKTIHSAAPRRNTAAAVGFDQSKRKLAPSGASAKRTGSAPGGAGGDAAALGLAAGAGAGVAVGDFLVSLAGGPAAGSTSSGGGAMAMG